VDERVSEIVVHGAALAFIGLELGSLQPMPRDHALHHLQHRRDQLGVCGQQYTQRDSKTLPKPPGRRSQYQTGWV
jgi:hypothetical protein